MTRKEEYQKMKDIKFRQAREFHDLLQRNSIFELRSSALRKLHDALGLDYIPSGVCPTGDDDIVTCP